LTLVEAEAWGFLQGINWIVMKGYRNVIFELDCKTVVDDVYKKKIDCSEYGLLLHECRTLLRCHNNYDVVYVGRQGNGSVYALAHAAISHAYRSYFDVILNCIATIIMNEIPRVCFWKKNSKS